VSLSNVQKQQNETIIKLTEQNEIMKNELERVGNKLVKLKKDYDDIDQSYQKKIGEQK
jgi:flagellar capping protein FliD